VIEASIRVGAEVSIGGAELDQALVSSFKSAAVDAVGSVAASEIGRAARAGEIDKASQLIAHAALGCGIGAAVQKDCAGGAAGAVAVEVVAEWTQSKLVVLTSKDSTGWCFRVDNRCRQNHASSVHPEWNRYGRSQSKQRKLNMDATQLIRERRHMSWEVVFVGLCRHWVDRQVVDELAFEHLDRGSDNYLVAAIAG